MLDNKTGFIKMFAPNGAEVYLPFDPTRARRLLAEYERQGLTPTPPGEYERERRDEVGAYVVRLHVNGDGSETPVVDVYFRHRNGWVDKLRSMRVYLNTDYDRKAFERAFRVSLETLEFYDNATPIDRGKVRPGQEKYIHMPSCPTWVIWRLNPASESDEQAPKRLFVRWESQCKNQPKQQPKAQPQQPKPQQSKPNPKPKPQSQPKPQPKAPDTDNPLDEAKQPISALVIVDTVAKVWNVGRGEAAKALYKAFGKGAQLSVAEARRWAQAQM